MDTAKKEPNNEYITSSDLREFNVLSINKPYNGNLFTRVVRTYNQKTAKHNVLIDESTCNSVNKNCSSGNEWEAEGFLVSERGHSTLTSKNNSYVNYFVPICKLEFIKPNQVIAVTPCYKNNRTIEPVNVAGLRIYNTDPNANEVIGFAITENAPQQLKIDIGNLLK